MRSLVALLLPLAARADDRDVSRPAFTWSEDNAKLYLNIFWSKTLDRAKEDDSSLFGESGYDHGIQPMDEVEVFFDTQRLELFAFNAKEGYHLDIPLRNRIVVPESTWKTREENDGIDIVMKKTRVGRWRQVQPLKGAVDIKKNAMHVKLDDQTKYNLFDAMQNQELRSWLETYPYHCLACHVIFDETYKGDSVTRGLWSLFRKPMPKERPKPNATKPKAWRQYEKDIEAEFEFDYVCDRIMSERATNFGTQSIVGSDVDFACNLLANNKTIQDAYMNSFQYLHYHAHHSLPESAHFWDSGPPSLGQIVDTAPDLIPEARDMVCAHAARACAPMAHHKYQKCEACQAIVMLADGILSYPRGDYNREREEVEDLITDDFCGYPVKGRIGYDPAVTEVCEDLLDDYEQALINTLTYRQRASENEKLHPSSQAPAVVEFCQTQTTFCKAPKRIPVKKHEPYVTTAAMIDELVEEVKYEQTLKKQKERDELPGKKEAYEFDVKHAKAVEGRTWVEDLSPDQQFGGDEYADNSRKDRAEEMEEYERAMAEARKQQADAEGADE